MQEIYTMDFRFIGSVVAKSFPGARIEVSRTKLRTVDRLFRERSAIEHGDIGTWARGGVT